MRVRPLQRRVDSAAFNTTIIAVIVANTAVLGLQTYQGVVDRYGDTLDLLNGLFSGPSSSSWRCGSPRTGAGHKTSSGAAGTSSTLS